MGLAHALDIAEDRNRIVVWTPPEVSEDAVLREIETRGVPLHAVEIEATPPGEKVAYPPTLRDRVRPLWGGLQVEGFLECTLGFLAKNRYGARYFVTASHCTIVMGAMDRVEFHQNSYPPTNNSVGFEIADPPPFWCEEEQDYGCRYSDAALIAIDDSVWCGGTLAE